MSLRVVELGGAAAGYCGRLFVHAGATVIRIDELANHDRTDQPPHRIALDRYLHAGKQCTRLDLADDDAVAQLLTLTQGADIVIAQLTASELARLQWRHWPARVRTAITPFGLTGPYRDWRATGSVLLAMGGYTALMGDADRAPLTMPGHYAEYQSGQYAYLMALATFDAMRATDATGTDDSQTAYRGRELDVSMWETVLSLSQFTTVMWTYTGEVRSRHGNDWQNLYPLSLFRCRDGWFSINIVPNFWQPFTQMLGMPELFTDPRFATNDVRMAHNTELAAIIDAVLGPRTMAELLVLGQQVSRVPTGIVMSMSDVLNDEHLIARDFWQTMNSPAEEPAARATAETPLRAPLRVPRIPFRYVQTRHGATLPTRLRPARTSVRGPLAGIRIADFTHVWAGPLGTRILADLGAEVIKIEAPFARGPAQVAPTVAGIYPDGELGSDPWNRQGVTNKLNRNKKSLAIDLKQPRGFDIVCDLIRQCDVVIDNFSARAMSAMGFGFEALSTLNPAIIHVAMPGYGLSGPHSDFVAFGPSVEPMSGLTSLMGYSDAEPRTTSVALPDAIAGVTAAAAVVTALHRRHTQAMTGQMELSLHEGAIALFGEYFVEQQLTGVQPARQVNRHRDYAPHGVYPCAGHDEWLAIACEDDSAWRALIEVLGVATPARWVSNTARLAEQDSIDQVIARATVQHNRLSLMVALQRAGVAAGALMITPDWLADEHLMARSFFVPLGAAHIAVLPYPGLPVRTDGQHAVGWIAAPRLGEHNETVVVDILGRAPAWFAQCVEEQVLWQRPSI